MLTAGATKQWYALQVMTGTEVDCVAELDEVRVTALAPARIVPELRRGKWQMRRRQLLPGYVFIRCWMDTRDYYKISGIRNAIRILPGNGQANPIPDEQMQWILHLGNHSAVWALSEAAVVNGHIRVTSGPLKGHEDRIVKWDKRRHRARIALELWDRRKEIEVGLIEAAPEGIG